MSERKEWESPFPYNSRPTCQYTDLDGRPCGKLAAWRAEWSDRGAFVCDEHRDQARQWYDEDHEYDKTGLTWQTVAEVGVGPVPSDARVIPRFNNEVGGNAVTSLVLTTEQGVDMIFRLDPPVQQSRVMMAIGRLLASLGVEMDFDFRLEGEGKEDNRAE